MYKPSQYLEVAYYPTCLPIYGSYFLRNWLPRGNQILTQGLCQICNYGINLVGPNIFQTLCTMRFLHMMKKIIS
jgi:hypothetical protein